jgi:uncharacterized protein (UPF0335 family)
MPYHQLCDNPSTPSHSKNMKLESLQDKAFLTARLWGECDHALAEVGESFGAPWEAARDTLNTALTIAEHKGIELDQFQGPDSLFRFPEIGAQVIVRVTRLPVPCDELAKLDIRIEKQERELKLLKAKRKSVIEKLKIKGFDFVTEKVTTAYKRLSK